MQAPPPPPGFSLERKPRKRREPKPAPVKVPAPPPGFKLEATGDVVDGDTLRLSDGTARLWGVDAFENKQTGFDLSGKRVPIGQQATTAFDGLVSPESRIFDSGTVSYGRAVVGVETDGRDAGQELLYGGYGLTTPEYLKADPARLRNYKETERLARVNRRGGHALAVQTPKDWRSSRGGGEGKTARFADERTPVAGMRPEEEQQYIALQVDPNSTVDDFMNFFDGIAYQVRRSEVEKFVRERAKGREVSPGVRYTGEAPLPITDNGDGALGAGARGVGDTVTFSMLDEAGGIVDALGGTEGRENIWNSDRRFGDVLWNNIDQNRAILNYDAEMHPVAHFGGQALGAFALPYATAARTPAQLARIGAIEGGAYSFGASEGDVFERAKSVPLGAATGATFGYGIGKLAEEATPFINGVRTRFNRYSENVPEPPPGYVLDDESQDVLNEMFDRASAAADDVPPPPPGFQLEQSVIAMDSGLNNPSLHSELLSSSSPQSLGQQQISPNVADAVQKIRPSDIMPIPSNQIAGAGEAAAIQAGRFKELRPFDERTLLEGRAFQSQRNPENYLTHKGPMDLVSWVRARGGINDAGDGISKGGDLKAMGMNNGPRDLDFAQNDTRMGPLLNDNGTSLDDMAHAAWEAGYFPDHATRPSVDEFLDALGETYSGGNRRFMQDDFDEVDRFYQQRSQNSAIGKAQEDGAPLVVDRSEPAGQDHLGPLPDTAYQDWPSKGGKVGNINLDKLSSPQDINRALRSSHNAVRGFDEATRGKVTHEATERLASDLNMTAEQLLSRRKGQAFNAEEALAARQILAQSGNELVNMARRVSLLDNPGDEELAAFRQAWVRHVAIQEQVSGATAEAGRALQAFRIAADSRDAPANVLRGLVGSGGGPSRLQDAAEAIVDLAENPGALNSFSAKASKPRFRDYATELWYNFLLSGPQTHVVNMTSNTLTALAQIPEHAVAATLGNARRAITPNVVDRVMLSEVGARSVGLLQGTKEGIKQFARTFRTGEPSDPMMKVEDLGQKAFPGLQGDNVKDLAMSGLKNPLRLAGSALRTPTRALAAEDELFKAMARRMELNGLAMRRAKAEGLKGKAARDRVAELVANPPDEMLQRSLDYGRYLTFTRPLSEKDGWLSALGSMASRATEAVPPLKAILPFVRTPTNLLKFSMERSPLAPFMKQWRQDFRAGGARRDLAVARAMIGSGMGALIAQYAAEGKITGALPSDRSKARLLRADGWQPYSIKVGGKYYSYLRLDPFASTLGTAADLATMGAGQTDKQREKGASLVVASIMGQLSDKTWLSGISTLVDALNDPERNAEFFIKRLAGSASVPTGVAQVARTLDPTFRETETVGDYIKSRVPGLSDDLLPRRDIWGEPIVGEGGLGPDMISPVWESTVRNDLVNQEMLRVGARIGNPSQRDMTAEEYDAFQERAGRMAKQSVAALIQTPQYQAFSEDDQADEIEKAIRKARKAAKEVMFTPQGTNGIAPRLPAPTDIPPPPPGFVLD